METTTESEPSAIERLAKFNLAIQCSPPSGGVDGDWLHIAYAVTLARNGKAFWTGPYKLGVGHVKLVDMDKAENIRRYRYIPEHRKTEMAQMFRHAKINSMPLDRQRKVECLAAFATYQKVSPKLADVMYSLLSDSSAMDETFADWCGNFGYDDDSIKALETYQACVKIGQSLSKAFTPAELQELREIFQDY